VAVELVATDPNDEPRWSRLVQLYAYDFSEFTGWDVADDALFHEGDALSRCWSEPRRHAFWCRVDGHLAGFVIVDERSRLTGDPDVVDVAEFFVMRKYRRKGIGSACAAHAFDLFPRRWEVRQLANNTAATMFWRRTIDVYTGGRFRETLLDDERWRGPVQSFDVRETDRAIRPQGPARAEPDPESR
jgi:predicted acetyltransferase